MLDLDGIEHLAYKGNHLTPLHFKGLSFTYLNGLCKVYYSITKQAQNV